MYVISFQKKKRFNHNILLHGFNIKFSVRMSSKIFTDNSNYRSRSVIQVCNPDL